MVPAPRITHREGAVHNRFLAFALAACAFLTDATAFGETIEDFYKRLSVAPTAEMLHPEGRYMIIVGDQTLSVSAEQFMSMHNEQQTIGLKSEILEFQILSKFETGDLVSVAAKSRLRQSLGAKVTVTEAIDHDILINKAETSRAVFGLAKAEIEGSAWNRARSCSACRHVWIASEPCGTPRSVIARRSASKRRCGEVGSVQLCSGSWRSA